MGNTTHVKEGKKYLAKEVHKLSRLGVQLMDSTEGEVLVMINRAKCEVNEKEDQDLVFLEFKEMLISRKGWLLNNGELVY